MRQALDTISENDVNGPRLFRPDSEFGLGLRKGTQFQVTGPSEEFKSRLERALRATSGTDQERLGNTIRSLASSVVKRARWTPDLTNRRLLAEARREQLSREDLTKMLHSQLRSAKVEIERLRNKSYRQHDNIVKLRGWGLCLDTFESTTSLNTRIPLLILERATCDLGDFLASSTYKYTPFKTLLKICSDIGNELGRLHAGNMTHGDMKPENVLLFAEGSPDQEQTTWTAKLCDFGNAESKSTHVPAIFEGKGRANESRDIEQSQENANLFEYWERQAGFPLRNSQIKNVDFSTSIL
jgi:serine/threonine protein kinase